MERVWAVGMELQDLGQTWESEQAMPIGWISELSVKGAGPARGRASGDPAIANET